MQRSNLFLKVISVVVLCALLCYLGVYVFRSVSNPLKTALAIGYTLSDGYDVEGIAVRSEAVVQSSGGLLDTVRDEGEKVSAGGLIAVEYSSEDVLLRSREIENLKVKIEQIGTVLETSGDGTQLLAADVTAQELSMKLQDLRKTHDFSQLSELEAEFITLTCYSDDGSLSEARQKLLQLGDELEGLGTLTSGDVKYIYSPGSGLFSSQTDGFEYLSPDALGSMTASQLSSLLSSQGQASGIGKLVYGVKWYYAALISEQAAKTLREGVDVTIQFDRYYGDKLSMTVERIGDKTDSGKTLVIFSCSRAMSETIAVRKLEGSIITQTVSGIRVPREAVKLDESGNTCVYTLTGAQAELKSISILEEMGDYYLVASDKENVSALKEGDEVIVSAKDLYDGKVVK